MNVDYISDVFARYVEKVNNQHMLLHMAYFALLLVLI